jgi:AcrR family transcriptional regulator
MSVDDITIRLMSAPVITLADRYYGRMVRWEPGARERLQAAALELYATRGFEETTVAEIALAAGLSERTFFRHFADKREVLFGRQEDFQGRFVEHIASGEAQGQPLDIVAAAVIAAAGFFRNETLPYSRHRQGVVDSHPELRERELLKMAALAGAIAEALRGRGVAEPAATLAAESGVTVFRVAFAQWLDAGNTTRSLVDVEREIFGSLQSLTAAASLGD